MLFFVCAVAVALVGALGVVLARNPVHSALFLLLTMVTMAVFFLMQDADLVAIIQIVVYASAIVVLFLFVITLLGVDQQENARRAESVPAPGRDRARRAPARQSSSARRATTGSPARRRGRPARARPATATSQTLAEALFTDYMWAFEITAVLLVIAVVGGVVLARRSGHRPGPGRGAEQ